jgi:hypothetical protein
MRSSEPSAASFHTCISVGSRVAVNHTSSAASMTESTCSPTGEAGSPSISSIRVSSR